MDFGARGWPPQPPQFSSYITKITKNDQFSTAVLTCWRVGWLTSSSKIHSKGKKANGGSF